MNEKFTIFEKIKLIILVLVNNLVGFIDFLLCFPVYFILPFIFLISATLHFLLTFCHDLDLILKSKQFDFTRRNIFKRSLLKSIFIEIKSGIEEGDKMYRKYFEI